MIAPWFYGIPIGVLVILTIAYLVIDGIGPKWWSGKK